MKTILVVANETLGGADLFDAVRDKVEDADGDARVVICVPRNRPRHGNIIYDDFVYDAAKVRIDLARRRLREAGIEAIGDIGDPDPYTAAMDAVGEFNPSEIIVSTLPATSSGWLRRDLIERLEEASNLSVTHVVTDIDAHGLPFDVTLALAAKTAGEPELLDALRGRARGDRDRLYIVVVPQEGGGGGAAAKARARMAQLVDRLLADGLIAAGMIGDPDPYTAAMNALQYFRVDDVVISTLPAKRSRWMRADVIARLRKATGKPVEHVEIHERQPAASSAA